MRELLLAGDDKLPDPVGDVLFLFDPGTSKDLISNQICIALSKGGGNIRVSNYAKYVSDYTPTPF